MLLLLAVAHWEWSCKGIAIVHSCSLFHESVQADRHTLVAELSIPLRDLRLLEHQVLCSWPF